MKRILNLLIVLMLGTIGASAQQESQYTQYMYNTMTINPAYTGTRGVPSIFGLYRTQWVGLDGAPETANFSIESPVTKNGQGFGLSVTNDRIGPSTDTNLALNYSYPIQLSSDVVMSLGLSGSADFMQIDYSKLNIYNPDDPYMSGVLSKTSPNVGAGVYFHSNDKWYAGLSVPQILETKFYDDVKESVASKRMHFYLMGGYVFNLNENLKFKPAAMVKAVQGAPLAVDLSANFLLNEKLTLGAAYRWDAAVSFLAGFQVTPGMNIGYAYDYDTNNLGRYNSGSHEIFLRFDLFTATKYRLVTPRFF
ncbi:type IX secretion system membrane protein PorP/SprF [Flavobacterium sp. MC2016-06]|jgi:type IX secretion system PorP/SprF family membrane protein|uniref:PorP/SprF family type IX secretion system membrane protein n=1 Tax=Flavobacterium sp. MC2016-06 TaxID=2676308 RepID=UPI0012BA8950|nr:type IX secretion system membrane protein PorP/SprF [Flavobacterium sp. MC2016-06]MBU3862478.1 type IX secretion system membrane protein PorP/SprF [Flavobacterium sp. MC2016-06]